MLWASDPALKQKFVVDQAVLVSMLPSGAATRVVAAPPAQGLYEQDGGIRMPNGRCEATRRRSRAARENGNRGTSRRRRARQCVQAAC